MSVIAIINQKGGCGKTTTAVNLSAALTIRNKRVLLIDLDPQGHVAYGLNHDPNSFEKNMFSVLCEGEKLTNIIVTYRENFDFAPAGIILATAEQMLAGQENREHRLKTSLKDVIDSYDYVIMDCPPNLGLLSINALMSAEKVIVPVEPSAFGLNGAGLLEETIGMLQQKANIKMEMRHLISLYDIDSEYSRNFAEQLHQKMPGRVFETVINRTSEVREATAKGIPVCFYNENTISYIDYLSLAHEVILWQDKEILSGIVKQEAKGPVMTNDGVCFMLTAAGATSVQIAGDFNRWNPDKYNLMQSQEQKDLWYTILPLKNGRHAYRFIIDGNWQEDPNNPEYEESLFGVKQSIVIV
jgi:chromosome partitioning protein